MTCVISASNLNTVGLTIPIAATSNLRQGILKQNMITDKYFDLVDEYPLPKHMHIFFEHVHKFSLKTSIIVVYIKMQRFGNTFEHANL